MTSSEKSGRSGGTSTNPAVRWSRCPTGEGSSTPSRRLNKMDTGKSLLTEASDLMSEISEEELLRLCRRVSMIHFEMILIPTVLVGTRIRPELAPFFQAHNRSWKTRLALVMVGAFVVVMPGIYAYSIMPYPCKDTDVKLGPRNANHTLLKDMELAVEGCEVERTLRSYPWSLGQVLMAGSLCLLLLINFLTQLLYCIYNRCGKPFHVLNLKRLLWRPLLIFYHSWIHKRVPNLKYCNDMHFLWPLYSPPSVIICVVYFGLVLEMLVISVESGRLGFGLFLAYAMGELMLKVCNVLLTPLSDVQVITNGEIKQWLPGGWHIGSLTIFDRLQEVILEGKDMLAISSPELLSVKQLDSLSDTDFGHRPSERAEGEETLDGVGVLTHVYVVDRRVVVNLVTGKMISAERHPDGLALWGQMKAYDNIV